MGVLGRTKAVEYRLYARNRLASLASKTLDAAATATTLRLNEAAPTRNFNQVFVGGIASFNYRKIYAIETAGELYALSLASKYTNYPEYWLRGTVRTGPVSAEILQTSYSPTLTQQEFVGNHYEWHNLPGTDNELANVNATHLTGRLGLNLPNFGNFNKQRFEASASGVSIGNLVYYGIDGAPTQESEAKNLLIGFVRYRVHAGRVGFDNQATYTRGGDVQGIRIPALVTNSRVFYESYIFRKAVFSQIGFEVYYQSRYRALDYSPSTQQFYLQNSFTIRNYPVVDAFISADIKAVTVFLKGAYINQGLLYDGYYTTPYYSGYPRRFQFGLKWNFFN